MGTQLELLAEEAQSGLTGQEARATSLKLFATVLATIAPGVGTAGLATSTAPGFRAAGWHAVIVAGLAVLAVSVVLVFLLDRRGWVDPEWVLGVAASGQDVEVQLLSFKLSCHEQNEKWLKRAAWALPPAVLATITVVSASSVLFAHGG